MMVLIFLTSFGRTDEQMDGRTDGQMRSLPYSEFIRSKRSTVSIHTNVNYLVRKVFKALRSVLNHNQN